MVIVGGFFDFGNKFLFVFFFGEERVEIIFGSG